MTHARAFTIIAVAFLCIAAASSQPVTVDSPCESHDSHGKGSVVSEENDPSSPPTDTSAIQAVTPSDIFGWPGPDLHLTGESKRTGIEDHWFALTGRVLVRFDSMP